jgi:REP element-mobilizing transposase RayT
MPRPLRPNLPETFHHVMNRAIDHGPAFRDDSDRVEFGGRLADIHERFGVITHAYCLMTTHFHLLLECPDGALSEAMQRLGSMYTRHVNDRLGRDGAIFRGRFASRLIDNDDYLLMACRYIHRNALELPEVGDVAQYRWSSHRTYLGLRATPSWMRTDEVLGHWNGSAAAFDDFVRHDVIDARPDVDPPRLRAMVAACAMALDEEEGAAARLARLLVLGWATSSGVDPAVVMATFGMNRGAVHSASYRARKRLALEPSLGLIIRRAVDLTSSSPRSRLGSDPWRDHSAARAAS